MSTVELFRKGWGMFENSAAQAIHFRGIWPEHVIPKIPTQHFVVIYSDFLNKFFGALCCYVCLSFREPRDGTQGLAQARELLCHIESLDLILFFFGSFPAFQSFRILRCSLGQGKTICQILFVVVHGDLSSFNQTLEGSSGLHGVFMHLPSSIPGASNAYISPGHSQNCRTLPH